MLRTERIPVTLYTSEDANAPRLTHAADSLKTVLKAYLRYFTFIFYYKL